MSWKHKLKLISHPFNALREFPLVVYKLPGKLRNWQSGSHPCFTLYINNWPKPQLRNGSPQLGRDDITASFFKTIPQPFKAFVTWPRMVKKTHPKERFSWRVRSNYYTLLQQILPTSRLVCPTRFCWNPQIDVTHWKKLWASETETSIDSVRVHTVSHSMWP